MLNTFRSDFTAASSTPLRYRPDIDGLRAIAVLAVVLFHAGVPGLSGGFAGVDIFFVISGYLITSLILKDIAHGKFSFLSFYLRRAKRIFPALGIVMAATLAASWFILLPDEFKRLGTSLLATSFFVSNFHFAENVGYFSGPALDKPLLHMWSLAIEEQFYILFPAALALFLPRLGRARMALALLSVAALSLLIGEVLVRGASETAFYMPHVRAWELLLGALIAFQQDRIRLGYAAAFLLSALGLGLTVLSVTMLGPSTPFPGLNALLPCLGAALLLLAGGMARTPVQAILALPPVKAVGLISYSLYLWHWPLFSLTHYHLNRVPDATEATVLIAASFVLAVLSWRFVEQPVRASALGLANPRRGIAATATPLLALALAGVLLIVTSGLPWRLPASVAHAYQQSKTRPAFLKKCTALTEGPNGDGCRFGAPRKNGSYDMVVWGDSHARHFVPVLAKIAEKAGLSGWQITPSACTPLLDVTLLNADHSARSECQHKDDVIKEFIRQNKNLKVIVLAARWSLYSGTDDPGKTTSNQYLVTATHRDINVANSKKVMADELQKTVDYFLGLGLNVVVLGQVPQFPFAPIQCNLRKMLHPASAPDCSTAYEKQRHFLDFPHGLIARLNAGPRLTRIFPHEFLCDGASCKSALNGTILYRDPTHLNPSGAETFYPFLAGKLQPLLTTLKSPAGAPERESGVTASIRSPGNE